MMKGFLKVSKLMGLMLVVSGLLFAGCVSDGGHEEGALAGQGGFIIPITVDTAKLTMDVGDGAGMAVGTWSGHLVGLSNTAACSGTPTAAECTLRVTNLDPNYYMANTYLMLSFCADCVGDKFFSNADLANGVTVFTTGDGGTSNGGVADINGAGFCVVEDGGYPPNATYPEPFNWTGCPSVSTKGTNKPLQFIHPDCGSIDIPWDFQTASGTNFKFYANIAAEWYPEVPLGDGRFDFANRTTIYLTLNSLDDDVIPGAVNKVWWRLGSYYRSSALAGYGASGDFTPAVGRYFAMNVLAEFPDRIESYGGVGYADSGPTPGGGSGSLFSDYEYYKNFAWIVRYDPTVIKAVTSSALTKKGGTLVRTGGLDLCDANNNHCAAKSETFTGFDSISTTTNFGDVVSEPNGWLFSYSPIKTGLFSWNVSGDLYRTVNNATIVGGYGAIWPVHAGHVGLAKVNMVPFSANYNWYITSGIVPSGTPDPEPEIGLGMYYFKVQPGTSGRGSQLYADHWATENGTLLNWTNGTAFGGFGTGTDDWGAACIPAQAGYSANQGCNDSLGINAYYVFHATEVSNANISHTGTTVPGGGSYQYWNVHLCVL